MTVGLTAMTGGAAPAIDESGLIRQAQRGSLDAFGHLVRRYDQPVLHLALRVTSSPQQARRIYQEAFVTIHRDLRSFRFASTFSVWIYRVVADLCMDHLRGRRDTREKGGSGNDELECALASLTPRERMVFELKHYERLSLRAVGEVLQASEESAGHLLLRATQKLNLRRT